MARSEEDRYDREARACLHGGGEEDGAFQRSSLAEGLVLRRAELSDAEVLDAIRRHEACSLAPGHPGILKADRRAIVTAVASGTGTGTGGWCVKEFRRGRWNQRLQDRVQGSRARRAWLGAHACRVRDLTTPRPLAILEGAGRSWFVNEQIVGGLPLPEWVMRLRPARSSEERRSWQTLLDAVADFVAELHSHRLRHRDLAAKNLLARENESGFEIFLLDLSDISLGRWPSRAFRIRNLGQLAQLPIPASRGDSLRFFQRYGRRHPDLDCASVRSEVASLAAARRERWLAHGGREWLIEHQRPEPDRP